MNEWLKWIEEDQTAAGAAVAGERNADPDGAARSVELGKITGLPPIAIFPDLQDFEKRQQANMAAEIVRNNPQLVEYVNKDPINRHLSFDDLGNLDEVTQTIEGAGTRSVLSAFVETFAEAYDAEGQGKEFMKLYQYSDHPIWKALLTNTPLGGGIALGDTAMRAFTGIFAGGAAALGEAVTQITGNEAAGNRAARDAYALLQVATTGLKSKAQAGVWTPKPRQAIQFYREANFLERSVHPWFTEGKEPPAGLHPLIDEAKKWQAESDAKSLDELGSVVDKSLTRERDPERFADFIRLKNKSKIGINADAIDALYGDKLPSPDDGLLGWVPDIANQLEVVRATGGDVEIPLADWLAHADPDIRKSLRDDIRVRPDGLTVNEATDFSSLPKRPPRPHTPVEAVRAAGALEPLFALGDRKLDLVKQKVLPDEGFGAGHVFKMQDERGKDVGYLSLSEHDGGKTLEVDVISGTGSYGPQDFGFSLMRDMIRQLKEQFPNAEKVVGYRISGAREKAGSVKTHAQIEIKLDLEQDFINSMKKWNELIGGKWEKFGDSQAYRRPYEDLTPYERSIVDSVHDVLDRIIPQDDIRIIEADKLGGRSAGAIGAYQGFHDALPILAFVLHSGDELGVARHEALHHLRARGYIRPQEWTVLRKHALAEGWLEKYNIKDRYSHLDIEGKLEEAIAEGYRDWAAGQPVPPEIKTLFEKIKAFIDQVREAIKEKFGYVPTAEEILKKIESGEIGRREASKPLPEEVYREARPNEPELPGMTQMEDREAFNRAPPGMTIERYRLYWNYIQERQKEDYQTELARAERMERKRQSQEWKAAAAELRPEIVRDFSLRPDIAADKFFREGNYFGKLMETSFKIDPQYLDPALRVQQLTALPKEYFSRRGGIDPSLVHELFGFQTANEMLAVLARLQSERVASKLRPDEFNRKLIQAELERRLEQRFGDFEESVLEAAKEKAVSETQLSILHEQTYHMATKAGMEFPFDKTQLAQVAKRHFEGMKVDTVKSDRFVSEMGKAGRAVEMALLKDEPQEAFKQAQRQEYGAIYAREAVRFEKEVKKFERMVKRYDTREPNKRREQEYTNYIQQILDQAGLITKLSSKEIQAGIDFHGGLSLADFAKHVFDTLGQDLVIADWILNGELRQRARNMTVEEFRQLKDAIDSIDHASKEVRSIELAGERMEFDAFKAKVIANIETLPMRSRESLRNGKGSRLWNLEAGIARPEEILKDLDLRKEMGPLWKYIMVPFEQSKAMSYDLMVDLANHFKEIKKEFGRTWRKTLYDSIPQTFMIDPYTKTPMQFTRQNLINVMLNWGNRSNIEKLTRGYATLYARYHNVIGKDEYATREMAEAFERKLKALIDAHATAEDWEFVKHMWEPFKKWQPKIDQLARNTSGVAPVWIDPEPIQTKFGNIEGGYWPIDYDRIGSGIEVVKNKPVEGTTFGPTYFSPATAKGHLKTRTGYIDYVDLHSSIEQAAGTMQQTIHDLAYRDSIMQASKVLRDKEIRGAIRRHYGIEYERMLVDWVKRVAGMYPNVAKLDGWDSILRVTRVNLVGHFLSASFKTLLSPDIGMPQNLLIWPKLLTNPEIWHRALKQSDELRHLVYNMDRDFREILEASTEGKNKFRHFQVEAVKWGFYPMMKVSQVFRVLTWDTAYKKAIAKGFTDFEAGQLADSKVRERHGAHSVVDLPRIMDNGEAMKLMTLFYGYQSTMYNWARQIPGQVRRGEYGAAAGTFTGSVLVGAAFSAYLYSIQKKDESVFKWLARNLALQPLSFVPFMREIGVYALEGYTPSTPIGSILKAAGSFYNDVLKRGLWEGKRPRNPVKNTANVIGLTTGLPLGQAGRTGEFIHDVNTREQRPKTFWHWVNGIIQGEMERKR